MSSEVLFAVIAIASVCAATPGPTTILAASFGAHYGLRAAMPHVLGAAAGYAVMAASGAWLGTLLAQTPVLAHALKWAGAAVLIWMAWKIAGCRASLAGEAPCAPFGVGRAFLFQWANPKAWATCIAAAAQMPATAGAAQSALLLAAVFCVAILAGVFAWAAIGRTLRAFLADARRRHAFNLAMGGGLGAVVLAGLAS